MVHEVGVHDRPINSWSVHAPAAPPPPVQVPFRRIVTTTTQKLSCMLLDHNTPKEEPLHSPHPP